VSDGGAASPSARRLLAAALLFGLFSSAGQAQPAQVNTIKDVFAKLRTCWKPPPPSRANPGDRHHGDREFLTAPETFLAIRRSPMNRNRRPKMTGSSTAIA